MSTPTKTFTSDEIKAAFWKTFHEAGEIFFEDYLGSPENNAQSTESWWQKFHQHLHAEGPGPAHPENPVNPV